MRKKILTALLPTILLLTAILLTATPLFAADNPPNVLVNGQGTHLQMLNIGGRNYVRAQDFAAAVHGTQARFDAAATDFDITPHRVINSHNYFALRDLAQAAGVTVGWDAAAGLVMLDTNEPYVPAAVKAAAVEYLRMYTSIVGITPDTPDMGFAEDPYYGTSFRMHKFNDEFLMIVRFTTPLGDYWVHDVLLRFIDGEFWTAVGYDAHTTLFADHAGNLVVRANDKVNDFIHYYLIDFAELPVIDGRALSSQETDVRGINLTQIRPLVAAEREVTRMLTERLGVQ